MKFEQIAEILKGIPYTQKERGKILYDHILKTKPKRILELGFAHGVASCYMAAALDELGEGHLLCVDLESSEALDPNLEKLLKTANLSNYVTLTRERNSYTWFLKKEIERNTVDYNCSPVYDFCFIDGPKNWTIDGFAFFAADKLLRENGYILFDDYNWTYSDYSKQNADGITIRNLSDDQAKLANIKLVFQLLVMQHPNYSNFTIDEDWAWAQKTKSEGKTVNLVITQSLKYKTMKKIRGFMNKR